jgi:hypothetical protein
LQLALAMLSPAERVLPRPRGHPAAAFASGGGGFLANRRETRIRRKTKKPCIT